MATNRKHEEDHPKWVIEGEPTGFGVICSPSLLCLCLGYGWPLEGIFTRTVLWELDQTKIYVCKVTPILSAVIGMLTTTCQVVYEVDLQNHMFTELNADSRSKVLSL